MRLRSAAAEAIGRGLEVRVRFWWDGRVLDWKLASADPFPPEHDVFMLLERERRGEWMRTVDPSRLLLIPRDELLDLSTECPRLADSIARALRLPRSRFGRNAYSDNRPWWEDPGAEARRGDLVKIALRGVDSGEPMPARTGHLVGVAWMHGNKDHERALGHLGLSVREDGRMVVTRYPA